MVGRIFQSMLVASLMAGAAGAANDPFLGKWKINPGKSKLTDEMKVEAAGANRYALTLAFGAPVETIVADGSEQPGMTGTTLSVTVKDPNHWTVVRKQDGRTVLTADWTLSADGQTLTDEFTGYQPDGSKLSVHYVYRRTAGGPGFAGTWDSESELVDAVITLQIQPFEGDGLSIGNSQVKMTQSFKLDGNDYPNLGPDAPPGLTSAGRRVSERSLEITKKSNGKVTGMQHIELSPDLKTLTMSTILTGESKPRNIFVFDRE
jgi:hypothetical protein